MRSIEPITCSRVSLFRCRVPAALTDTSNNNNNNNVNNNRNDYWGICGGGGGEELILFIRVSRLLFVLGFCVGSLPDCVV